MRYSRMISVIVPTLNEEKFIGATLRALKSQNYKGKYEIIVADGGSEDKTVDIAKTYADKVVVLERGIARGRNTGARAAKGGILLFVDADTILLYNTLTEVEKTFKEKGVVAMTCPALPISHQAKDFMLYWIFNQFVKASVKAKKAKMSGFCFGCRKATFDKLGGFNERLGTNEDFDLSSRLSKKGKIKFNENTFVITSPRRVQRWGRFKSVVKYIEFYLKQLITGTPVTMEQYGNIR